MSLKGLNGLYLDISGTAELLWGLALRASSKIEDTMLSRCSKGLKITFKSTSTAKIYLDDKE